MVNSLHRSAGHEIVARQMDVLRLNSLLYLCECLAEDFAVEFSFEGKAEISGYFDAEKVDRGLQNLLTNAFEAAMRRVHLRCIRDHDALIIQVIDDGAGVSEHQVPYIFERGFSSGKKDGTGLGLAYVKHMAEGHEGHVAYEREQDATKFTLVLKNVFVPNLCPDVVEERVNKTERPLLFFECSDKQLQAQLLEQISRDVPEYHVTSNRDELSKALLVCTDDLEIALQASECGAQRTWNPTLAQMRNLRFAEALKNLAAQEWVKFAVGLT